MSRKQKHLVIDFIVIVVSIYIAYLAESMGWADDFLKLISTIPWVGMILTGMFFTSVFTTAPAIVFIGHFAQNFPLWEVAILGGLGSMLGDYVIFRFIKDRVSEDVKFLMSHARGFRFKNIFKTRLFRFFVPFIGALIIASPLPDELGIMILGLSKIKDKYFLPISYLMNTIGILFIGWVALLISQQV